LYKNSDWSSPSTIAWITEQPFILAVIKFLSQCFKFTVAGVDDIHTGLILTQGYNLTLILYNVNQTPGIGTVTPRAFYTDALEIRGPINAWVAFYLVHDPYLYLLD
jgi:hypothetical protein